MPPKTRQQHAEIREGIQQALKFKGTDEKGAAKLAEMDPRTLVKFCRPDEHPDKTWDLDLSTVVQFARSLKLTVSQFIGETPLDAPTAPPSGELEKRYKALEAAYKAQSKLLAELLGHSGTE